MIHEIFFYLLISTFSLVKSCADGQLGMSNGDIKDWQISASSTYPTMWDPNCHEKFSRIYMDNGKAWCAKHRSDSEWLQIDLGVAAKVKNLATTKKI